MGLQLQNVSKSFGVDIIFKNISMNIGDNEKVGLIGVNGAGKTTLLRVISGELSIDEGSIFTPKDCKIGFLKQDATENITSTIWETMIGVFDDIVKLEEEMRSLEKLMGDTSGAEHDKIMRQYGEKSDRFEKMGGFELRAKIMTVLNGMGFEGFDLNTSVLNLSGGEKTKLSMAKLLLEAPEILLLDEPTNHLDFKTMQWLEGYLKSYKGSVITVSHDRYFLDSLCDNIYEIERNKCTKYTGNYSVYLEQKRLAKEIELKHYNTQQQEIKHLSEYVEKNKARASTAKMAKSKQKMLDKIEVMDKPMGDLKACKFNFEITYPSYKDVLTVNDLSLFVNKGGILTTIAKNINFEIKRQEKIALIGPNGIGKSTLLKTLIEKHRDFGGEFEFGRNVEISYYDQEQRFLDSKKRVIDVIWDLLPKSQESQIRTYLGNMLFSDDDGYKLVGDLSGGEKARLMLLVIMIEKANTLLLDEPTNHLDLPSKEALDDAISQFDGTVFIVSHDRYFLNKVADKIYELTPDGIVRYQGNYDDYLVAKSQSDGQSESLPKSEKSRTYEEEKRRNANIKNKTKKSQELEIFIEETEDKIAKLNDELNKYGTDYDKLKEIYQKIEEQNTILAKSYEEWNSINEELDRLQNE